MSYCQTAADRVGELGDTNRGDSFKAYMKVVDRQLANVRFQVHGCPAAVAAAFDGLCGNFADLLHARERTAEHVLGEVVG